MPRECTVEILERRGEQETSWSALCLDCGWQSEDTRSRAVAEERAEQHKAGIVQPWQDPRLSPSWDKWG